MSQQSKTIKCSNNKYIVIDELTGEILDTNSQQGFLNSKAALIHYAKNNQHLPKIKVNLETAKKWYQKNPEILESIRELQLEESIIKQPILNYKTFKTALLRHNHPNISIRYLWDAQKLNN